MYNSLVEKCFKECVESFRRKDLDNAEERVRCVCGFLCLEAVGDFFVCWCSVYRIVAKSL